MSIDKKAILSNIMIGKEINLTSNPNFKSWPEFDALRQTPQDPEWHAEGDVLIHTEMVLHECAGIFSDPTDKKLLYLSALFHDIAKPETTRYDEEIQHTIAPGHERIGGVRTRSILRLLDDKLTHEERRCISQLVSTHHLVKRAVKKFETNDAEAIPYLERLASRVDTQLLWGLEMADMKGRHCIDKERQVEIVEFFRMLCEENNIFGSTPTPWFESGQVDDLLFEDDSIESYALAEMHRRRLLGSIKDEYQAKAFLHEVARSRKKIPYIIFPIGASGSGKSRALEKLSSDFMKISPDSQREIEYGDASIQGDNGKIYQICTEQMKEVLRTGGKAYFDATHVIPDLRSKLVNICHDYGGMVVFWIFDIPLETLKKRNAERSRHVPESVIEQQMSKFEWPLPEESHKVLIFDE